MSAILQRYLSTTLVQHLTSEDGPEVEGWSGPHFGVRGCIGIARGDVYIYCTPGWKDLPHIAVQVTSSIADDPEMVLGE